MAASVGYGSDLPEQIGIGVAAQNIRRYFDRIDLDERGLCVECRSNEGLNISEDFGHKKMPNKSPEPTPTAVTPRASEMKGELKKSKNQSNEARVAPAAVVAHL